MPYRNLPKFKTFTEGFAYLEENLGLTILDSQSVAMLDAMLEDYRNQSEEVSNENEADTKTNTENLI